MAEGGRKEFGRRGVAPPVVANAPQGLPGAPRGPSPFRKRSLAVALISIGAASIGGYALYESSRRTCASQGDQPQEGCHKSTGGHGGSSSSSGRGWFFGSLGSRDSGASPSAAAHQGGGSAHSSFFGGFGHMGFGHGGGS